jgi:hypothetical protein
VPSVNRFERSEDESSSGLLRRWDRSSVEWAWAVYARTGCYIILADDFGNFSFSQEVALLWDDTD